MAHVRAGSVRVLDLVLAAVLGASVSAFVNQWWVGNRLTSLEIRLARLETDLGKITRITVVP